MQRGTKSGDPSQYILVLVIILVFVLVLILVLLLIISSLIILTIVEITPLILQVVMSAEVEQLVCQAAVIYMKNMVSDCLKYW